MEWKVILFDFNSKCLKEFNIFKHAGFKKDFIDMCHIELAIAEEPQTAMNVGTH